MKFGHTWKKEIETLNPKLAQACIDYKRLKKILKKQGVSRCISELDKDALKVNHIMRIWLNNITRRWRWCCAKSDYNDKDIYDFIILNKLSAKKIIKKIKKKGGVEHDKIYDFMRSDAFIKLIIKVNDTTIGECPICLEEGFTDAVITRCGHIICLDCVLKYIGVWNKIGTIGNLLYNARMSCCPLCRQTGAFLDLQNVNIIGNWTLSSLHKGGRNRCAST